jgi:hypothetical protein
MTLVSICSSVMILYSLTHSNHLHYTLVSSLYVALGVGADADFLVRGARRRCGVESR